MLILERGELDAANQEKCRQRVLAERGVIIEGESLELRRKSGLIYASKLESGARVEHKGFGGSNSLSAS